MLDGQKHSNHSAYLGAKLPGKADHALSKFLDGSCASAGTPTAVDASGESSVGRRDASVPPSPEKKAPRCDAGYSTARYDVVHQFPRNLSAEETIDTLLASFEANLICSLFSSFAISHVSGAQTTSFFYSAHILLCSGSIPWRRRYRREFYTEVCIRRGSRTDSVLRGRIQARGITQPLYL